MENLKKYFSNLFTEKEFVVNSFQRLQSYGFTSDNAIASVCICRDEISQTFKDHVNNVWGYAFDMSSLAGIFTAGKTGLSAAIQHAPNKYDKFYYIFYVLPHIAIGKNGALGECVRRGIDKSTACGALVHLHSELIDKRLNLQLQEDDLEINILKRRLLQVLPYGETPDLLSLTNFVKDMTLQDIQRSIDAVGNPAKSVYAFFSGIQIHASDGCNYVSASDAFVVVDNQKILLA